MKDGFKGNYNSLNWSISVLGSSVQFCFEELITLKPGFFQNFCFQGASDSFSSNGGRIDGVVKPPGTVVIP